METEADEIGYFPDGRYVIPVILDGYDPGEFRVTGRRGKLDFQTWRRSSAGWRKIGGICRIKYDMFDVIKADDAAMSGGKP